ncbi:MAG: AAA family ATPase [Tunicatimonas sp.]
MPVQINIKGSKETNEHKDAIELKETFDRGFSGKNVDGEILIISSATLFGQETKDIDLIALGKFNNYSEEIKTKAKIKTQEGKEDIIEEAKRKVYINNFCFVFETKRHRAVDIQLTGLTLLVKYGKRLSDVTVQSENQKYSLVNFFKDRLNFAPYICNFIWLKNMSWQSIKELLDHDENRYRQHNYLPSSFSLRFLLQLACVQSPPFNPTKDGYLKRHCQFSSLKGRREYDLREVDAIFNLFQRVKDGSGELTRKKVEKITSKLLDNQQYAQAIGEKLVIISGRAGTGKTIKLLSIACDLAIQKGARSLILTYNHALVSDIQRTLALAEIPDGIDNYTVNIQTLHKFFYEVLIGFNIGVSRSKNGKEFIANIFMGDRYQQLLMELERRISEELINDKDMEDLMLTRHQQIGWDYILIDEAQDWDELEKNLIFSIFGKGKVIIADGVDQLIRSQKKCNWTRALKPNLDFKKTHEKKGLRQKVNLVSFVNTFAEKLNVNWELQAKEELVGGKVIISTTHYSKHLHDGLYSLCSKNGNSAYEMMFLVPPSLVERKRNTSGEERKFKKTKEFEDNGIIIWDATNKDLRTQYAVDLNQHRLLQYESCRGLEGWTVICLDFDDFIEYKMDTFQDEKTNELALESFEEKRRKFVHLWALIPMTRAIDTLVIQVKNKEGYIASLLREVYVENPDYVEWVE